MKNTEIFSIITGLSYEEISAYLNLKKNKAIEKGYKAMQYHQNLLKKRLYQVNQELISYGTYEIDNLTEIIDTCINLNNRTTAVKKILNRTLYYEMGHIQTYKCTAY